MVLQNIVLSLEDFNHVNWDEIIKKSDKKICETYNRSFFATAKAENTDSQITKSVYEFLGHITSPMLKSESDKEPFFPLVILRDGSRSSIPKDFNEQQLTLIKQLAPNIEDPELKARIADILWETQRDFEMAKIAVNSYLESAKRLEDPENCFYAFPRIERALRIAARLGKNNEFFNNVINYIEHLLDKYQAEDPLFFSAKLMRLLQRQRLGDYLKYAQLSEQVAQQSTQWDRAREYWEVASRWYALNKDQENQKRIQINIAETYVEEAKIAVSNSTPSYMMAAFCLQKAIEAYRKIGGTKERREELHKLLLEYQPQSMSEMGKISQEIDIRHIAENVMKQVSGKSLQEAIIQLALMGCSPSIEDLRLRIQKHIQNHPLQFIHNGILQNESGKNVANIPSIISDDPETSEKALQAHMQKYTQFDKSIQTIAVIHPAIYQINLEHNPSVEDFAWIVINNPFIPPGRENIYARGFWEGIKGDFLVSTHLLIPQIEHSIRYLLERRGCIVSGLDDRGIQDEHNINVLIHRPELIEMFGEDIVFDLKGLLVDRYGNNLRNQMAHGLLGYEDFFSAMNCYLWWLTLRLCCLPIIKL